MASRDEFSQNIDRMIEKPTLCLVHGAWHGAWCWNYLKPELEALGHRVIAPDLPIETTADFDDYAQVVAEQLVDESAESTVLVGHSMAGNVITRVPQLLSADLGKVAIVKNIYVAASIDEMTVGWLPKHVVYKDLPEKNTLMYQIGTLGLEGDKTKFNREFAQDVFYPDCTQEIAEWAVGNLRTQLRSDKQTVIKTLPDVVREYIKTTRELVFTREWEDKVASWLGIKEEDVQEIYSSHSPMLSRVEILTPMIAELALSA